MVDKIAEILCYTSLHNLQKFPEQVPSGKSDHLHILTVSNNKGVLISSLVTSPAKKEPNGVVKQLQNNIQNA